MLQIYFPVVQFGTAFSTGWLLLSEITEISVIPETADHMETHANRTVHKC